MKFEQIQEMLNDKKIDLEERFVTACVLVDKLKDPLNFDLDKQKVFYGVFKQAIFGDCKTTIPGLLHVGARDAWKAWNGKKGTKIAEAQQEYINLGLKTLEGYKGEKERGIINKVCDEIKEEELTKLVLGKLTVTKNPTRPKPNYCILDQAKLLKDAVAIKIWTEVAERIKARKAVIKLESGDASQGVLTFSDKGSSAAQASALPLVDLAVVSPLLSSASLSAAVTASPAAAAAAALVP